MLVAQAEGLDARVVASVELAVCHKAHTETCTEGVAEQGLVTFCTTQRLQFLVHRWQSTRQSLAIGVEVSVVVDIYWNTELLLKEWTESHAVAERWEVRHIEATHDTVGIVCWARECEADSHRLAVEFSNHLIETIHQSLHTEVKILCVCRFCDRVNDEFVGTHCTKNEVCTACIECDDCAVVISIHIKKVLSSYFLQR